MQALYELIRLRIKLKRKKVKQINFFFANLAVILVMCNPVYTQDTTLTVTKDGHVGIGTTVPSLPLEIHGPGNSFQDLGMEFENTTSLQRFVLYNDGTSGLESFNIAQPTLTPYLTIRATGIPGNVGIGTTSPDQKLSVAGIIESLSGGIKFPDGTIQTSAAAGSGSSLWSASGSDIFYNAGKVGIGTASPAEQLHVWGNLQVGDPTNLWTDSSDNRIIKFGDGEFASIGEAGGNDRLRITGKPISMEGEVIIKGDISMGGLFGLLGDVIVDGKIGIGKPSSGSRLEINDDIAMGPMILLNNTTATGDAAIDFHSAGVFQANIAYEPTGDYLTINSHNTSNTVLNENGGNVGIGTADPTLPLEIQGPGNFYQDLGMEFENTTSGQRFVLYNDGTSGKESFNIAQPTEIPSLTVMATGNPGNVGIGTQSPNYKLHVNGTAAGTSWINLSSGDYKENITRVADNEYQKMLDDLIKVDINTYKYKEQYGGDGTIQIGFLAEDMPVEVLSEDGKGIDVYGLLAYTIGALKAQQKKIEELEKILLEKR